MMMMMIEIIMMMMMMLMMMMIMMVRLTSCSVDILENVEGCKILLFHFYDVIERSNRSNCCTEIQVDPKFCGFGPSLIYERFRARGSEIFGFSLLENFPP